MVELPFELLESKLRPPRSTGRGILRTALVEQLNRASDTPVVMLCAGPGYGKTTALAQWAASSEQRPFAWVSVDQHDNDPVVLLTYIAAALDRIAPIDPGVFEALASPGTSVEATVLPRLGAALASMEQPTVLGLDDVHTIANPRCIDAVVALAGHVPEGSQLALAARDGSALPLASLRTRGLGLELGPDDLRMDEDEARELLGASGLEISDEEVAELVRRTEGWPAGLYLAALSATTTGLGPRDVAALTGNDPFVAGFLRSEFFAQLPPHELRFLTRTSMLEQMSGPLCDTVLAASGSAEMLESLAHSNRFVVSLDRGGEWYRCHPLVRELLATDLARSDPDVRSPMLRRASEWCAANGQEIAAVQYGQTDGDPARVSTLMERWTMPIFQSGRTATVDRWFEWLDANGGSRQYPSVAVIGAMFHAVMGRATASDRYADLAAQGAYDGHLPDGSASIESWRAMLRAFRGMNGIDALQADAALAVRTLAPTACGTRLRWCCSAWRPSWAAPSTRPTTSSPTSSTRPETSARRTWSPSRSPNMRSSRSAETSGCAPTSSPSARSPRPDTHAARMRHSTRSPTPSREGPRCTPDEPRARTSSWQLRSAGSRNSPTRSRSRRLRRGWSWLARTSPWPTRPAHAPCCERSTRSCGAARPWGACPCRRRRCRRPSAPPAATRRERRR
jgi:LuxR family transcriptional regulator, maltose regulon positive regulatory protein